MLKKTVDYVDFAGNKRTETVYFNLTQTELTEVAMDLPEGVLDSLTKDDGASKEEIALNALKIMGNKATFAFIKSLILKSYGIASDDGRRFIKTEELTTEFSQTVIFDNLMMEFMSDDVAAAAFVNAVMPSKVTEKMADRMAGSTPTLVPPVTQ